MKNNILIIIIILIILASGGIFYQSRKSDTQNPEINRETSKTSENQTPEAIKPQKLGQYRTLEGDQYTINKKDSENYEICINGKPDVCISLLQYGGSFQSYYEAIVPAEEIQSEQIISSTIHGKKDRKCIPHIETEICFNENTKGTLIMVISDLRGEGFFGGEYDPKEILKNIDF